MQRSMWRMVVGLAGVVFCGMAQSAEDIPGLDWKEAPPVPFMSVAPCVKAPGLDGPINPAEWEDACAINGLAVWAGNSILYPPTLVYVACDAENAYIAYRCTKSKSGWWRAPNRFRDSEVYLANDYVEFFFSPDDPDRALVAYQFCINSYGAVYDCRNMPAFGLKEIGYNNRLETRIEETPVEIQFKARISAKELDPRGFQSGQKWLVNFCRSWPQCGWSNRGGSFIDRPAMGRLVLDVNAPAVQWLKLHDVLEGQLRVQVAIKNTGKEKRSFVLSAVVTGENTQDRLADASQTMTLDPGERKELLLASDKTFAGKRGHLELSCTGGSEKTLYYHQFVRFDNKQAGGAAKLAEALKADAPVPREIAVKARYGQMAQAVEVSADTWSLRRLGQQPQNVLVTVFPKTDPARIIAKKELTHFQKDFALCRLDLPVDAPFGAYGVKADAIGADGKTISSAQAEFTRLDLKDPAVNRPYRGRQGRILDWIGNTEGARDMVIPPWSNIALDPQKPGAVEVFARRIELESSGLPAQIFAKGKPILAAPMKLVARSGDKEIELKPVLPAGAKGIAITPNVYYSEASWKGQLAAETFKLNVSGRLEYDGFMQYKAELVSDKPLSLNELYLDIPISDELAWRLMLPDGPMPLPKNDGLLWESKSSVDNDLMGTLVPYVWIGNQQCGLTWGADHTRGWYEKSHESVITLSRESGVLHLRVKFVQGPASVETTTFEFSLLPTPSKPRPEGWRNYAITPDWNYYWDCGWYNQIWDKLEGKGSHVMKWDDPPEGTIENGRKVKVGENGRAMGLPYLNPQYTCSPHPCPWDVDDQSPVNSLFDNDWANMPSRYGALKPIKSYRDWTGSLLAYYMREWGLAGFYVDEPYIAANFDINLLNGSGWFDREGNLRGSYHVMDMREYIKQMYVISYKYGRTGRPFSMVHASSFGMSPFWTSFAGSVCFGEGSWGVRKVGESILDVVPLENLQLYNGDSFGYIGTFFGMYLQQQKDSPLCAKSYENTIGTLALHDMTPGGADIYRGANVVLPIEKVKLDFGIGTSDVEFIGYWYPATPVESSDDGIKASTYRKPSRSLVVVVNTDIQKSRSAKLLIHGEQLGFYGGCKVIDAVSKTEMTFADSRVELQLEPREVKYLYVVPKGK